jgi:hypothetical protein
LPEDECEVLANVVLSHVPVENFDFRARPCTLATLCDVAMVHLKKNALIDAPPCSAVLRPEFAQSLFEVVQKNTGLEASG